MKNLLSTLFIFLTLSGYCQSKFSVGLMGSIGITGMRDVSPSQTYNFYKEKGIGYQGEFCVRYQFTKTFSLQSGFSLVSYQMGSGNIELHRLDPNDLSVPNSLEEAYTFKVMQVPILCSFYFGSKIRFGFSVGTAYNYHYLIDQKTTSYFDDHTEEFSNSFYIGGNNQFITSIVGIGAEYRFGKYSVRLEPTGTYQLYFFDNPYANENYRLWSMGINLSAYYHF